MAASNSAPPRPEMDFSRIAFALPSDSERVCRERPRRCNHAALSGIKTISRHPYRKTADRTSSQYRAPQEKEMAWTKPSRPFKQNKYVLRLGAPTAHSDQQCSQAAGEQRYCCRLRNHRANHPIGEVVGLAYIGCGREEITKV